MHPLVRTLAAGLALALGLSACSTAGAAPDGAADAAPAALTIELHSPRPGLYSSAQPAASDWAVIAGKGVTTVIDLRTPGELKDRDAEAEVRAAGMDYHRIPVAGLAGIHARNAQALAERLAQASGPVLVHCATANRSGGLLALAQAQSGMPAEQALQFGRAAGMKGSEEKVRDVLGAGPQGEGETAR